VNVCKTTDGRTDDATITTRFRVEKTARLRAAVEEAKAEIATYRAEREGRYARLVQEQSGNKAEAEDRLKQEFDTELSKLQSRIAASKGAVVDDLIKRVTSV